MNLHKNVLKQIFLKKVHAPGEKVNFLNKLHFNLEFRKKNISYKFIQF